MFVYSVKASKNKLAAAAIAVTAVVAAAIVLVGRIGKPVAKEEGAINYKAESSEERIAFISQFGWKTADEPSEVREILIPENFEDGYTEYAEINKAQKLDLEIYKGMRAKRWTYDVLNYPGKEGSGTVQINLLVYNGRVIGGDVSSLESGGFMHGFEMPDKNVFHCTDLNDDFYLISVGKRRNIVAYNKKMFEYREI